MKARKYLAIFLVAVMALTVVSTAGVITAPKAAAHATNGVTAVPVQYVPGKTYVFLPWQYNDRQVGKIISTLGTPKHIEWAKGGIVYSSATTNPTYTAAQFVQFYASTGINWRLIGTTDMTKPCTVIITVSYAYATKESDSAFGTVQILSMAGTKVAVNEIKGGDPSTKDTVTKTYKLEGTLNDFFGPNSNYFGYGNVFVYASSYAGAWGGQAQAIGAATMYGVMVSFPTTTHT